MSSIKYDSNVKTNIPQDIWFYMEIIEVHILFDKMLWGIDSWFPYKLYALVRVEERGWHGNTPKDMFLLKILCKLTIEVAKVDNVGFNIICEITLQSWYLSEIRTNYHVPYNHTLGPLKLRIIFVQIRRI